MGLPTIRRLPVYLHLLRTLEEGGRDIVSSDYIAAKLKFEAIQVRKDLAVTGIVGKPKIGYYVPTLIKAIEEFLGWDNTTDAFLVGAGSLGTALMGYAGFSRIGLNVLAAFDVDEARIGRKVHGKEVFPLEKLSELANRMHVNTAIMTVPGEAAQEVADLLVRSGIRAIWNFTAVNLDVPEDVVVQNEDLSSGLAVLSVKLSRKLNARLAEEAPVTVEL